jgi:hypothetical protein
VSVDPRHRSPVAVQVLYVLLRFRGRQCPRRLLSLVPLSLLLIRRLISLLLILRLGPRLLVLRLRLRLLLILWLGPRLLILRLGSRLLVLRLGLRLLLILRLGPRLLILRLGFGLLALCFAPLLDRYFGPLLASRFGRRRILLFFLVFLLGSCRGQDERRNDKQKQYHQSLPQRTRTILAGIHCPSQKQYVCADLLPWN